MNIEITEEEREFLERVCNRALVYLKMGIKVAVIENQETDSEKLKILSEKLKK